MSARRILLNGVIARTAYGLLSLFAPKVIFAGQGKPPPDSRYFNALFGGRDLTVAAVSYAALRSGREREALLVNVSCEATDFLALVQEIRERRSVDSVVIAGALFNLGGWIAWAMAARALRAESVQAPAGWAESTSAVPAGSNDRTPEAASAVG